MGLIRLAKIGVDAIGSTLGDQWLEYFYCDSIDSDTLMVKGQKKVNDGHNYNTKGMQDNIISNGSVIAVNEGQCMMIVDNGKIVDICAEAGEFKYDNSTEPSIFAGNFLQSLGQTAVTAWRRFTFGGNAGKDQRVYYFNTKEIMNNLYGTATPIPFRVVDNKIGLDLDTELKCNGKYSFHIADPVVFYTKVCGNVKDSYNKSELTSFMKDEMITALQPALGELSAQGIRVVGMNYKDDRQKAISWLKELGNPYALSLFDGDGMLGLDLGVYGAPETFLIDGNGIIRYRHAGDLNPRVWEEEIKPLWEKYSKEAAQ